MAKSSEERKRIREAMDRFWVIESAYENTGRVYKFLVLDKLRPEGRKVVAKFRFRLDAELFLDNLRDDYELNGRDEKFLDS